MDVLRIDKGSLKRRHQPIKEEEMNINKVVMTGTISVRGTIFHD